MNRSLPLLSILLLFASCSNHDAKTEPTAPTGDTASGSTAEKTTSAPNSIEGRGVLLQYVDLFRSIAQEGNIDPTVMVGELDKLSAAAKALRKDGVVNDEFLRRYERLLRVTKLILTPSKDDAQRAAIEQEVTAFVQDVEGSDRAVDPMGGLAEVAPALSEELVSLYLLLGGVTDRAAAREQLMK